MRIGIDVNELVDRRPSGVCRYVTHFHDALHRMVGGDDRVLPFAQWTRWSKRARIRANGCAEPICWVMPPLTPWPRLDVVHYTAGRHFPCPGHHRTVVTVHDLWDWHEVVAGRMPVLNNACMRLVDLLGRADGVICISDATRRDLQRFLPDISAPTAVIHHGIDPRFRRADADAIANVRNRLGLPVDYLLYLGNHHRRKNVDRLVQGYLALPPDAPPLVLAGCADVSENARIEAWGGGRIRALGYLAEADVPTVISGACASVFVPFHEGFGFPVLESYRCGVPVVASRGSSLDELVVPGTIQVDPWDVTSITDGIARQLEQPVDGATRQVLIDHASAFTWRRCAQQAYAFYRRLVAGC